MATLQTASDVSPAPGLLGAALQPLQLRYLGGRLDGQVFCLPSAKCTIGAASNCTLQLPLPGVEPTHVFILHGARATAVRSLAAGVLLNGAPVQEATLGDGDRLTVGPQVFEVVRAAERTHPPAGQNFHAGMVPESTDESDQVCEFSFLDDPPNAGEQQTERKTNRETERETERETTSCTDAPEVDRDLPPPKAVASDPTRAATDAIDDTPSFVEQLGRRVEKLTRTVQAQVHLAHELRDGWRANQGRVENHLTENSARLTQLDNRLNAIHQDSATALARELATATGGLRTAIDELRGQLDGLREQLDQQVLTQSEDQARRTADWQTTDEKLQNLVHRIDELQAARDAGEPPRAIDRASYQDRAAFDDDGASCKVGVSDNRGLYTDVARHDATSLDDDYLARPDLRPRNEPADVDEESHRGATTSIPRNPHRSCHSDLFDRLTQQLEADRADDAAAQGARELAAPSRFDEVDAVGSDEEIDDRGDAQRPAAISSGLGDAAPVSTADVLARLALATESPSAEDPDELHADDPFDTAGTSARTLPGYAIPDVSETAVCDSDSAMDFGYGRPSSDGASSSLGSDHHGDESDESIEVYMNQLLARVRGNALDEGSPSKSNQNAGAANSTGHDPSTTDPQPVEDEVVPVRPYQPRSEAPHVVANLAAMRELANDTARSAIAAHAKSSWIDMAKANLIGATAGVVGAVLSLLYLQTNVFLALLGVTVGLTTACWLGWRAWEIRIHLFAAPQAVARSRHPEPEDAAVAQSEYEFEAESAERVG